MLKIEFRNATARDIGYGLEVNGEKLEDIISRALGTVSKSGKSCNYDGGFKANSCDITLIIDPHPTEVIVETDTDKYDDLNEFMEDVENEHFKKDAENPAEE